MVAGPDAHGAAVTAAPSPPRRRRRRALAAAIGGGVVLLAGLGGGVLLARAPGAVAAYASARLHRRVAIDGGADVRILPGGVEVVFRKARIGRPAWAGPGEALTVEAGRMRVSWMSILHLKPVADTLELDGPVTTLTRDAQGRPDWTAGPGSAALSQPIVVRRLAIARGRLAYVDAATGTRLDAAVAADPDAADGLGLHVDGRGVSEAGAWSVDFRAPAVRLGARSPTPLQVRIAQGPSHVVFRGELPPGLDAARVHGDVEGSGPDLHDLARLLHIPFPHTAPYRLQARLERAGPAFRLLDLRGRTGTTELTGRLTVTQARDGRRLDGAFRTPDLTLGDLLVLVTAGQAGTGRPVRAGGRLVPDVKVDARPLRPLSGTVTLDAPHVRPTGGLAVRSLRLTAGFDRGRVSASPLVLGLPRGALRLTLGLDVRRRLPAVSVDMDLQDASTVDLLGAAGARAPVRARLDGRVRLTGAGPTLHAAAAAASGYASFRARGGAVGRLDAQALGGDLRGAFASLLTRRGGTLPLRCLAADFDVSAGRAEARRLVFATAAGSATGSGAVDLRSETLDLSLRGEPAQPGLTRPHSYVRVSGPIAHPKADLRSGGLGGLIGTLLSVVPFPGRAVPPAC